MECQVGVFPVSEDRQMLAGIYILPFWITNGYLGFNFNKFMVAQFPLFGRFSTSILLLQHINCNSFLIKGFAFLLAEIQTILRLDSTVQTDVYWIVTYA